MRCRLCVAGEPIDLEVATSATVADLRDVLGVEKLHIDGRLLPDTTALVDSLFDGVDVSDLPGPSLPSPEGPHLRRRGPRIRFNRPPREAEGAPPAAPPDPPALTDLPGFPMVSTAVSVLGGAAMAVMFGSTFLIFAAIAPVTAVGMWAERYLRARGERRRALDKYHGAVTAYRLAMRRHRRRRRPPTVENMLADIGSPRMWNLRRGDPGFGTVVAGVGHDGTPMTVDLHGQVGLVGSPADTAALRRWLVLQAAIRFGPADLVVDMPGPWATWLPHRAGRAELRLDPQTVAAAPHRDALPAGCATVLTVPRLGQVRNGGTVVTWPVVTEAEMDTACRLLARFLDPELPEADLPSDVALGPLDEGSIGVEGFVAAVGMATDGPVLVDLDRDGPHLLVAGTTGSGKSEFLRTFIVSLARRYRPTEVGFVLVDFKGGAAFGPCVDLPHVAGLVTDLDGDLPRLVEALRGEVEARERFVARRRVDGIGDLDPTELRRLVVAVDEFAALRDRHTEDLDGLIDIARRGRSLGIHLALATQRPAGVVSPEIQSNVTLRVCFRVSDVSDAADVIGDRRPADIDRRLPGRGFLRLGAGEIFEFQAARAGDLPPVTEAGTAPDLRSTIDHITGTHAEPSAEPIMAPAPRAVTLEELPPLGIGVVDDPRRPRPFRWDGGNLLVVGGPAGPAVATLVTVGVAAACHTDAAIYAVGAGLDDLERIPAVGAVVLPDETERQARLLEVVRRRPEVLLIVAHPAPELRQAVLELAGRGVRTVMAVGDAGQVTGTVASLFPHRLVFRLGDPFGHLALGIPAGLRQGSDQAIHLPTMATVTIASVGGVVAPQRRRPDPILALPEVVPRRVLPEPVATGEGWKVAYGLGGAGLIEPVTATLRPGRPWVVAGPSSSGKTTLLETFAVQLGGRATFTAGDDGDVLLIDDAHLLDDPPDWDGPVVCATSSRVPYAHWLRDLLPETDGCVLRPRPVDGDLWGRALVDVARHPGRGLHIEGDRIVPVQAAAGDRVP